MFAQPIIDEFSLLCEQVGYDLIRGSFSACTEDEVEGQIELLVAQQGKYLMFYIDKNDRLVGKWDEGEGMQRLVMGKQVEMSEKMAVINGIAQRIQA